MSAVVAEADQVGPAEEATPPSATPPTGVGRVVEKVIGWFKDPNPILVKELRVTFRANLFIRFLYLSTALVAVFVLLGGASLASASLPPAEVGQWVFQLFFVAAFTVVVVIAPVYASTVITSERKGRTYESLILSGMSPTRIVRGKFLAVYAAMFLVLVAQAPVVGLAFLFGGVSPGHVVVGYVALFLALGPAVAFGLAVSSRLSNTLVSILITWVVYPQFAFFAAGMWWALGEGMNEVWGTTMHGPLWFTEAFVARIFHIDAWLLLLALPVYLLGITTWFFFSAAVAGVRPKADDRSTPFKFWAAASTLGLMAIVPGLVLVAPNTDSAQAIALGLTVASSIIVCFHALVFVNEPNVPPRLSILRARNSRLYRTLAFLGPGGGPTLRFNYLIIMLGCVVGPLGAALVGRLFYTDWELSVDLGILVLVVMNTIVIAAFAGLGAWLRTLIPSGAASRALVLVAFFAAAALPVVLTAAIDIDSMENLDESVPPLLLLSPNVHQIFGIGLAFDDDFDTQVFLLIVPAVLYGLIAIFCFFAVEFKTRSARKADEILREERGQRARESVPSAPLLATAPNAIIPSAPPIAAGGPFPDSPVVDVPEHRVPEPLDSDDSTFRSDSAITPEAPEDKKQ